MEQLLQRLVTDLPGGAQMIQLAALRAQRRQAEAAFQTLFEHRGFHVVTPIGAPALMYVGLLMLSNVAKIDFNDFVDAMAGLITAVFIVLTCNIVTGIMIGFATLVIGRLVSGEWRKLNLGTVIIAVALVVFYAGGWAI